MPISKAAEARSQHGVPLANSQNELKRIYLLFLGKFSLVNLEAKVLSALEFVL